MMDRTAMLDEVFRRAEGIRRSWIRRQARLLGAAACILSLALLTMIASFPGSGVPVRSTALGAFLLGPETGGYVIVALAAFALGIVFSVIALRKRSRRAKERRGSEGEKE